MNEALQATQKQKIICMVAYDGCQTLDITGPLEVFAIAHGLLNKNNSENREGYELQIVSQKKGPITMTSGIQIVPTHSIDDYPFEEVDTLIISGGEGAEAISKDEKFLNWIREKAKKARRITSICTGSLILAEAGLLEGKKATTHWYHTHDLEKISKNIEVCIDSIFVKDGNIYTSAGITSGMDLCLSMVEEDYGRRLSLRIAKTLVLFIRRPGNQAQFSDILSHQINFDKFGDLIEWINQNIHEDLTIDTLAQKAAMSPRNFARKFLEEAKQTPAKFVETLRIEKAKRILEESKSNIDIIAFECGFKSSEHFRRAFERRLDTQPHHYRERFQSA